MYRQETGHDDDEEEDVENELRSKARKQVAKLAFEALQILGSQWRSSVSILSPSTPIPTPTTDGSDELGRIFRKTAIHLNLLWERAMVADVGESLQSEAPALSPLHTHTPPPQTLPMLMKRRGESGGWGGKCQRMCIWRECRC
jgi:hypothetical protein